ncbi:MAG: TRAP transporter substrate-binding protein DctP [Alphaproteobacteria bacterium]
MPISKLPKLSLIATVAVAIASVATTMSASAGERFRISLETPPTHHRNIAIRQFVDRLSETAGDQLDVELFESGQLFGGGDVPRALAQGTLEMGAPGMWQNVKFVSNAGVMQLPMFYGATRDQIHAVMDGELGDELVKEIESKMKVVIIGPQLDHGYANIYTVNTPIRSFDDLKGLKLRVVGGFANTRRYQVLGAAPVGVPWPDTPLALTQGTVEGLFTTHVTVASAKLWDAGIKYAFEDQQWFAQYVPMVSRKVWDDFDEATKAAVIDAWAETINGMREFTEANQGRARKQLEGNGINVVQATPEQLSAMRTRLLAVQNEIVEKGKMDADYVARVKAALDAEMSK